MCILLCSLIHPFIFIITVGTRMKTLQSWKQDTICILFTFLSYDCKLQDTGGWLVRLGIEKYSWGQDNLLTSYCKQRILCLRSIMWWMKIPSPRLGFAGASYSLPDSFIIPSRHCKCVLLCLAGTMAVMDLDDVFSILVIFKYIFIFWRVELLLILIKHLLSF